MDSQNSSVCGQETSGTKIRFYASLTGPFLGLYYPLPPELKTDSQQRLALNTSKLKGLWCSIYDAYDVKKQVQRYGGSMLSRDYAAKLDYDSHVVFATQPA